MLLRFTVAGTKIDEEFELYSSQAESVIGFYDGLSTACLDLVADATLLNERNEADLVQFEKAEHPKLAECRAELAKAETLRTATVHLSLEDERADTRGTLRLVKVKALTLPPGALERLAGLTIKQAAEFQAAVQAEAELSPDAEAFLYTLDSTRALPLGPRTGGKVAIAEEDTDDILPAPVKPKAKAKSKAKALAE